MAQLHVWAFATTKSETRNTTQAETISLLALFQLFELMQFLLPEAAPRV